MTDIKNELRNLKPINFLFLFIAGVINAFGVMLFLFPVKLYDSGISGLSMLLDQVTPQFLTISIFLLVINVPIFLFGFKKHGAVFTIYSVFTVGIYSLFTFLIKFVFKIDISDVSPLAGSDLLLCTVFGGLLSGIGSGMTIRFGGALDGIEVLAVTFAKKLGISIGTFVSIFNFVLYIVCGVIFESWVLPLYSIVTYFIGSKTVDFVVEGIDRSKCAMIITTRVDKVTKALSESFHSSGTFVNAKGGYLKNDKYVIYIIINRFQLNKLKNIVKEIDQEAFVSISEVSEVIKNEVLE